MARLSASDCMCKSSCSDDTTCGIQSSASTKMFTSVWPMSVLVYLYLVGSYHWGTFLDNEEYYIFEAILGYPNLGKSSFRGGR